ncbi:uncharacterized protein LOC126784190 [Argentina anserina]|uniref:uncharacterized protein LOC126784190 n=1 Tax=Argentina anserina TaxID=57926 RepID=UPI0021768FDB|nr:uncharacterized protein LOC126784190 [Potentilla anserina]
MTFVSMSLCNCIIFKIGAINAAAGSAYAEFGNTKVIVLVFGLRKSKKEMLYSDIGLKLCRQQEVVMMSSSVASTEPSERSVNTTEVGNLSAPLWKYVINHTVLDDDGNVVKTAGGNVSLECKFCHVSFNGSHSRVRSHLLKEKGTGVRICSKINDDQSQEVHHLLSFCEQKLREKAPKKVYLPPSNFSMSGNGTYFPLEERDDASKKRRVVSPHLTKAFKIEERQQCDAEVARLFYTSGLPFNVARNPYYQDSYLRASHIPGYTPPGYNALRTTLLDDERRHIERVLQPVKKTWKETGVSLCSDGWTDDQRRPLINMMAASTNGTIMLKAINCEGQYKDRHEISRLLLESINEIGAEHVVQVVTDNAPVCAVAGAIVETTHPRIFWTPCVVHTLNLVLKDILKAKSHDPGESVEKELGWLTESVVNDVWFVKNFIMNHGMRLSMYNDHCALKLLTIAETRFASHFVMHKRFKEMKSGLQAMVISLR